jgi:hypothetical protein
LSMTPPATKCFQVFQYLEEFFIKSAKRGIPFNEKYTW